MATWKDSVAETVLNNNKSTIIRNIEIPTSGSTLLIKLKSLDHLTRDEVEMIETEPTNALRVSLMLDYLDRRLTTDVFRDFTDAISRYSGLVQLATGLQDAYHHITESSVTTPETPPATPTTEKKKKNDDNEIVIGYTDNSYQPSSRQPVDAPTTASADVIDFCCFNEKDTKFYAVCPNACQIISFNANLKRERSFKLPECLRNQYQEIMLMKYPGFIARCGNKLHHFELTLTSANGDILKCSEKSPVFDCSGFINSNSNITCICIQQGVILAGSDKGSIALAVLDNGKLQIRTVCEDRREAVRGMTMNNELVVNWRDDGWVEVGEITSYGSDNMDYQQTQFVRQFVRPPQAGAKVQACIFLSEHRIGVIVRQTDGVAKLVVWRYKDDFKKEVNLGTHVDDGTVEIISVSKDRIAIASKNSRLFVTLTDENPCKHYQWPKRPRWFKADRAHMKWLVSIDDQIQKYPLQQ